METAKTYTLMDIQKMLSDLENSIIEPDKQRMSRIKIPIPKEYGGGWATGATQEEAVRHLLERIRGQLKPETSSQPTFRECWEKWIALKEGQDRSPCTIDNYKRIAATRLLPFFGGKPVDEITPDDIQGYFNSVMHLSRSYSVQSRALLRGIFDRAERMGYVAKNPMRFEYIRSKKQKKKVVLQDEDLLNVIADLEKLTGKDYIYACLLCFTALRRGEILGLQWTDLDFEMAEIHVVRNVIYPDGVNEYYVTTPKDDSEGTVHLQSELAKRLLPYRKKHGYLLPYSDDEPDKPITRSMFAKMWARIRKTLDLKGATSHSFRASYASMMNAHCVHIDMKALQGALRHKTPDLAIRVYTKENENKTKEAEMEYDEYLCGAIKKAMEH